VSSQARAIIAIVCLVGGIALFLVAAVQQNPNTAVYGSVLTGPVLGYAFGDRNGEKRTAAALAERGLDPSLLALLEQAVVQKSSAPAMPAAATSSAVE